MYVISHSAFHRSADNTIAFRWIWLTDKKRYSWTPKTVSICIHGFTSALKKEDGQVTYSEWWKNDLKTWTRNICLQILNSDLRYIALINRKWHFNNVLWYHSWHIYIVYLFFSKCLKHHPKKKHENTRTSLIECNQNTLHSYFLWTFKTNSVTVYQNKKSILRYFYIKILIITLPYSGNITFKGFIL